MPDRHPAGDETPSPVRAAKAAPGVPRALVLNPRWSSTAAVEAVRLWAELPDGPAGAHDVSDAAQRARLKPFRLREALVLLEEAGLISDSHRGYVKRML